MNSHMARNENTPASHRYAHWPKRFQAAIIDSAIITIAFLVSANWLSGMDLSTVTKVGIVGFLIFVLEPGVVSFSGATIGHHLMGLKIERVGSRKNLNPVSATIRFLIKSLLGVFSLIFMLATKRHQALHDFAVNSIVVATDKTLAKGYQALPERTKEVGFKYPSIRRRIAVIILFILLYLFGWFVVIGSVSAFYLSDQCLTNDHCSNTESVILLVFDWMLFIVPIAIIILGWRSQLWGCRKYRIDQL